MTKTNQNELLSVENIIVEFEQGDDIVHAVNDVSFDLESGDILGIVGESGCGKSVTSLALVDLIQPPGRIKDGRVLYKGEDILSMSQEEVRRIRGNKISYVFQEPMSALNPAYTVGWQIAEPMKIHNHIKETGSREEAIKLLEEVGIPDASERVDDYPHEFSGGMRQRAMIAMALACQPDILIADEPTTSLDVTIESQILELIRRINQEQNLAVIFITHDLGVVAQICDKVAVMYMGKIVEIADTTDLFDNPRHPYTQGLMNCVLDPLEDDQTIEPIGGAIPDPRNLPAGCNFEPRCPHSIEKCMDEEPELRKVGENHQSACIWDDP